MAHSLSAKKRIRQNAKRRLLTRSRASTLKSRLSKYVAALSGNDVSSAEELFRQASKSLDREAVRGTIHRNAAARRKSRLARRLNAMKQKAGG